MLPVMARNKKTLELDPWVKVQLPGGGLAQIRHGWKNGKEFVVIKPIREDTDGDTT